MFKKFAACMLICFVFATYLEISAIHAEVDAVERIEYYYYLQSQSGTTAKFTNAPGNPGIYPRYLNDNNPATIAQIEYSGAYDNETGLLEKSFYLYLDLGGTYALRDISVKWYPTSQRCVKYIIEGSTDGRTYATIADHSDNVTEFDTITDDNLNVKARYLRFEILGNYRQSDGTRNTYFVISELTVNGVLDSNSPKRIPYTVDLALKEGADGIITQPSINIYPTDNLYDKNLHSLYEIQYSGAFKPDGTLEYPYYMIINLGGLYELDSYFIAPYLDVKGLRFKVAVSEDNVTYYDCFDHSDNNRITITSDTFDEGVKARYVRFEICGNFKADGSYNTHTYISELAVFGTLIEEEPRTEFNPRNPKIAYTYSLKKKDGAEGVLFFTNAPDLNQVPENLNDGDLDTIAQIQYSGEYEGNLLKDSFYLILDLGSVHELEALLVKWYPVSRRCVKYIVSVSEDGENYTEVLDYSDNVHLYDTVTDDLSGLSGRYVRFEILGNYRATDQTRNGFFVISEIEVYGMERQEPNPQTFDMNHFTAFIIVLTTAISFKKRSVIVSSH